MTETALEHVKVKHCSSQLDLTVFEFGQVKF